MSKNFMKAAAAATLLAGQPAQSQISKTPSPAPVTPIEYSIKGKLECAGDALMSARWVIHLSGGILDTDVGAMTIWNGEAFENKILVDKDSAVAKSPELTLAIEGVLAKSVINAMGECADRNQRKTAPQSTLTALSL